ncbi:MAG: hypothetical protein AB1454_04115 [Candidatus Auribacterota bacterium]
MSNTAEQKKSDSEFRKKHLPSILIGLALLLLGRLVNSIPFPSAQMSATIDAIKALPRTLQYMWSASIFLVGFFASLSLFQSFAVRQLKKALASEKMNKIIIKKPKYYEYTKEFFHSRDFSEINHAITQLPDPEHQKRLNDVMHYVKRIAEKEWKEELGIHY